MSRTQRENIFIQEKDVWEVAIKVMNAFERGDLKDQKLNQKQLITTPDFKLHFFQALHNLKLPNAF